MDLNVSLERCCGNDFDHNPWVPRPMTLTTKAIILTRMLDWDNDEQKVETTFKVFDGLELMQIQGFSLSYLRAGGGQILDHGKATHVAGNMFNAFMFLGFMLATTAGVAIEDRDRQEQQNLEGQHLRSRRRVFQQ